MHARRAALGRRRAAVRRQASSRRRQAQRAAVRSAVVQVPDRRRADQRQRDGDGPVRPLRVRAEQGRLPRLRRRAAADGDALQRGARAGQSRHRARHQRQHGRRQDARRAGRRSIASSSSWSTRTTRCSSTGSTAQPELVEGWTRDKRRVSESLNRIQPRGSTSLYDAVADAVHLAQQGHNRKKAVVIISDGNDTSQPHRRVRGEAVDPRDRSARLCDRDRFGRLADHVVSSLLPQNCRSREPGRSAAEPPRPIPMPFPMPGGRRPPPAPPPPVPQPPSPGRPAAAAGGGARWKRRRQQRRSRQRRGAARHHRRQRRPHRDRPLDARPRSRRRRHRRRVEQAGTTWATRRPGAKDGRWHSIRVEVRSGAYHVRARRGYVAGQ